MPETAPLVLTCGDPSGIGPEIAAALMRSPAGLPRFAWIGDPTHLPRGTVWQAINQPRDAASLPAGMLGVIEHPFPAPAPPGRATA